MKNTLKTVLAGACLAVIAPQIQAASICDAVVGNLVTNCGFETGDFTGWTLSGNDVPGENGNLYGVEGGDPYPTPAGTAPNSGNFQAYFSDFAANPTTLSQSIATNVGDDYSVSFYLSQQVEGPGTVNNSVKVGFGSATLATLTNLANQSYQLYSYTVDATSTASLLSLTFGNDIGEFLLDDVVVTDLGQGSGSVPLPASAWLLLSALGGLALFSRRTGSSLLG